MILNWNEIKSRAIDFTNEWSDTEKEEADAKQFLVAFFNIFGINNRKVATFEHRVKKLDDKDGYIDLLWKGTLLIEMKSRGKNLDKAYEQAAEYLHGLKQHELPKYILVCDFENFRLYDLEDDKIIEFKLKELYKNIGSFYFILGFPKKIYKEEDPANVYAAEMMGKLHDRLREIGFEGHPLEVYLVRVLFCLFAEDTTIFQKQQFQDYIEQRTNEDGSDLAPKIQELFQVLNTPKEKRFKNLDEQLADFPFVNGRLFDEILPFASFDSKMRKALLECCYIDWSKISPAIFGSMFQSVMNPIERRNLGAHYTSEGNILKVIKPLFLDELWKQFEAVKGNRNKLIDFHKKIGKLKFLDPACGCGNFLIIAYRELRILELEILKILQKGQQVTDLGQLILVSIEQMYGIEYEEFPARVAEVAMYLVDHQMNMLFSEAFGNYFVRLPLNKAATIVFNNALKIDWESIVPKNELAFIMGNPPFIGKQFQNKNQKADIEKLFLNTKGTGVLDYVTAWYIKAAKYIQDTNIKVAFVSTNSISQGEQVGILWNLLFSVYRIKIHFAHRTFKWSNEARGNAAVHCVIIGFANFDTDEKSIFDYKDIKGEAHEIKVKNINPYLVDAKDFALNSRSKPLNKVPVLVFGNMANDGGHLVLQNEGEYADYLLKEPAGLKFIKSFVGSEELINNMKRYCFWLKDANPSEMKKLPILTKRVEQVKAFRLLSTREATKKLASSPALFGEIRQKEGRILVIPRVSSENRNYIPIAYYDYNTIINDRCTFMNDANNFHFGILTSLMHMTWMKNTCGRLKSDYNYSNNIVYNNFPWPENLDKKQITAIEKAAQKVLDARLQFPDATLADLYSPLYMPPKLLKAHQELDKVVDLAYRPQPFVSEANRMEFLFELYEKYTADLFTEAKVKKGRKKKV